MTVPMETFFFLIMHFGFKGNMNDSVRFQFRGSKSVTSWSSIDSSDSLLPIITKQTSQIMNGFDCIKHC